MNPKPSKSNVKSSHGATASYVRQPRQRKAQNYLLIWVDASIDQADKDCQNTLAQLKNVVNDINLCTESDQCIQALNKVDKEQVFVITSGSLGQHLVPEIHGIPQLDAIYIFCGNKSRHEEWTQNWTKIKGVHTNIKEICQALQLAVKKCDQDTIAISFLTMNEIASADNLNQLEPTFMYTQLFKEILLDTEYDHKAIKDLAAFCREVFTDNPTELQVIKEFQRDYHPQKAIWWYTRECFTYKMLNQALRTLDADIIINMGFFLRDVHQQIQQLHEQQVSSYGQKPFLVYRGQGLMKSDFEKLRKTKGGLMSFNNFLSTSTDKEVSVHFARRASAEPDKVGILFTMSIDPCIKSTPFASIQETSDESEKALYYNQLGYIKDGQGDYKKAIWYYEQRLEIHQKTLSSNHPLLAISYNNIGSVYYKIREYSKALSSHEKALEIRQKTLPSNHPDLACSYNNIGLVYKRMREYSKALSSLEKALEIFQKTLPSNHPSLATSYNNIGLVYDTMEEYSKALSFYEKDLEICQKTLPSNHPELAASYNNIGLVYYNMKDYSKALSYYERALGIWQRALPPTHPHIKMVKESIEIVKKKL
ncbi:unnamed protein product [Adineta steineri]|uniref:Kinesin light chain n=1 Tax=Adineta steineri TaxID=433720 RepID=A0A814MV24_9BILA|nr:unnamed protein product [Adineta steineri]